MVLDGDSVMNRILGVSVSGQPKRFLIESDANSNGLRLNSEALPVSLAHGGADQFLVQGAGDVRAPTLPTSAPAQSGRLWVDTAAGNVVKRVP